MNNYQYNTDGKILVTGGLGAIGMILTKTLVDAGRDIIIYDSNKSNNAIKGVHLVNGDVRDECRLLDLFQKEEIAGVIHLAAVSQVGQSEKDVSSCMSVNVGGTLNLMKAIGMSGQKPWIVNCSSREVYGEPDHTPVPETARLKPLNVYGASKLEAEKIVRHYATILNLNIVTIRPSNVYGSIYDLPGRVIPQFIHKAMSGTPLEVYGGEQVLDFIHVSDMIDGLMKTVSMLERVENDGYYDDFNLATGTPTTLQELIGLISLHLDREIKTRFAIARPFDVQHFVGDTTKATNQLGFRAKVPLEKGIPATIAAYRRQMHSHGSVWKQADSALCEIACKEAAN